MGGTSSKALAISSPTPEKTENGPDYSIMKLCGGDMKKFEYMLFISAESCRLSYCDVGILQESLKAYGRSPDVLNKVISHYDAKFASKKRNVLSRLSGKFAPPDSYDLKSCQDGFTHSGKPVLIRYISSPTDTTCTIASPSALVQNENSIIQPTDCILTFKGSSSMRNWEKNLRSLAPSDFAETIKDVAPNGPPGLMVSASFVVPIVEIFNDILEGIDDVAPNCTRIFVFGHSKGGAESELAGAMLAVKFPDKEIHVISLGAPKVIAPGSRDAFNNFFFVGKQGKFTLTRIESVGTIAGDNVTDVPTNMVHPGWGTKTSTLDSLRQQYGVTVDGKNKRNPATWPFPEPFDLWDRTLVPGGKDNSAALKAEVEKVIGEKAIEVKQETQMTGGATYYRIKGSSWTTWPHMEYFGMFFWGSQRLAGMGNPAKTALVGTREAQTDSNVNKTFVANIFSDCTKYQYEPWVSRGSVLDVYNKTDTTAVLNTVLKRGGRRTYRKSKRSSKKTRRN